MHSSLSRSPAGAAGGPARLPTSEANFVESARTGDGSAFTELFHQYNAAICTYLARLVGNDELGRDLAQETFIRAWKSLPDLTGELQFKPWLYRIATNLARSHLRHERLVRWLPWHEQDQAAFSLSLSIEGPENQAGEAEQVQQVLARLGSQSRSCLLLQLSAGFSQREIAAILNISEKSVSAYVSRGREQFRQFYRQGQGDTAQ